MMKNQNISSTMKNCIIPRPRLKQTSHILIQKISYISNITRRLKMKKMPVKEGLKVYRLQPT
uniref:Uncharacterized protein n=1 Tax=Cryptococcus bacillisporus CA1280 TaxID=1296109 RepID=A0A0D0U6Z9_CRYGA|nr:hypothetical protein I312_06811 [Cryptococcus bacillisporus CA1280]